ncbi:unnamed protein product [Strongylus vulgaris]|uniref:SXP/RAL-2 family protein Ani s 5-like cation-binding domain-containing protein n=1 Tax=Strongylus vulgaris TaxID=40348 RepID=A0A3P7JAI6_STRVU|nr:unnamed protein product [Strongylus vulgaris]
MRFILLLFFIGLASCEVTSVTVTVTPKMMLMGKVTQLLTGFLNEDQLSKAIDLTALEIHNGKKVEEIMTDLHEYFDDALDEAQIKVINDAYRGMIKDLGEEAAGNVMQRIKKIVAYAVSPTLETVNLHEYFEDALDEAQIKVINDAYRGMIKDLGEEAAGNVMQRIKKIVAYAVSPTLETIRAQDETPDLAYLAMSRQLTPDFVKIVVSLVRDTLTPMEWNSLKIHFGPIVRIL